jgi:Asp-tRNA(Asn)/Glu-tRNA(Gln) amidotransferase A subunit family amidase
MIRPGSYCGIYAMKPTWNLVANEGAKVFSATLDTVGWYGRSAEDLRRIYEVFDEEPPLEPDFEAPELRVAVCRTPIWNKAEPATQNALNAAVDVLRRAGATVVELELPPFFKDIPAQHNLIMRAEGRAAFLPEYRANHGMLGESFREMVENLDGFTRAQLVEAYDAAGQMRATFDGLAREYHAVLAPSASGEAPVGLNATGTYMFNFWTLLHAPCINVPGFKGPNGLPVGLTLTGPRFTDRRVLSVAHAIGPLFAAQAEA